MKKSLLKKIVMSLGSLLSLLMLFLVKVKATNVLVLGDTTTTRDAGKSSYFAFLKDAKETDMFGFARVMMWIAFILMILCTVYFIGLLVLELINKDNLIKKLSLVTRIVGFVLVFSTVLVLVAGFDKEQIVIDTIAKETLNITLFGFSWMLSFVFGALPAASEYLINE